MDDDPEDVGADDDVADDVDFPDAIARAIAWARPKLPPLPQTHEENLRATIRTSMRSNSSEGGAGGNPGSPWPRGETQLGRYTVLGAIGRGAMGEVLAARDPELGRRVALKLLHTTAGDDAPRLRREAQALARLSHPNVVQVFEVGEERGRVFVAMELVEGQTLRQWQEQRPPPSWADCVKAYLGAGRGLAAAHAEGLIHRDFKPGNCMIDAGDQVKVLDFGLARQVDMVVAGPAEPVEESTDAMILTISDGFDDVLSRSLTRTGTVVGTMAYMAPEAMRGSSSDACGDQFGFCVSLYEAVYGERPFAGETARDLVRSVVNGEVRPSPSRSSVPVRLRRILLQGIEVDPRRRWPSMDALLAELERLIAPRTRRWTALGLSGLGLAALGLGLAWYAEVGYRCEGAEQELTGVWDDERRHEVESAILATSRSFASDTWSRVEHRLDAYGESWRDDYTEVCEATRVREVQTEEAMQTRMRCLGNRRRELSAVVSVLARADETTVAKAVELVAGLPDTTWCRGPGVLEADILPPQDPQVAERVEAERARLAEGSARHRAGALSQGQDRLDEIVAEARAIGYEPLVAEALAVRGTARLGASLHDEGKDDLHGAFELALEHDHGRVQLTVALELIRLYGLLQPESESGLRWGRWAVAMAERRGAEPVDLPRALIQVGMMLREKGELQEAKGYFERSLSMLRETAEGDTGLAAANALENMSIVSRWERDFESALQSLERAQEIRRNILGEGHPSFTVGLVTIGNLYSMQERPAEALDHFQRAVDLLSKDLGEEHVTVGLTMVNGSAAFRHLGDLEQSLAWGQRSLEILESKLGADSPQVAKALSNLGNTFKWLGRLDEGIEHSRRAAEILEAAQGPRSIVVGQVLSNIGGSLVDLGELNEGLSTLHRAIDILETSSLGPKSAELIGPLSNQAGALRLKGDLDDAERAARRALDIGEPALGAEHAQLGEPLIELARVALARDDLDSAQTHAERATGLEGLDDVSHRSVLARARLVMAMSLWSQPQRRAEAITLAEQAHDTLTALGKGEERARLEAEVWLEEHRAI